jgi:hypothetical protein
VNSLQALITGMIAGSLAKADQVEIDVEVITDLKGDYLPKLYVKGRNSGTLLLVSVEVLEEGDEQ